MTRRLLCVLVGGVLALASWPAAGQAGRPLRLTGVGYDLSPLRG